MGKERANDKKGVDKKEKKEAGTKFGKPEFTFRRKIELFLFSFHCRTEIVFENSIVSRHVMRVCG